MRVAMFLWESSHQNSIAIDSVADHVSQLAVALQHNNQVHVFKRMDKSQQQQKYHDRGVTYHPIPFDETADNVINPDEVCREFLHKFKEVETINGRGQEFQIIHGHEWMVSPVLSQIEKKPGRACVFSMHSNEHDRSGNSFLNGVNSFKAIVEYEKKGALYANAIIAPSHAKKSEIMEIHNIPEEKIHLIYNGISCDEFDRFVDAGEIKKQYGIGPLDPTILYVGSMTAEKEPDLIVDAIPAILKLQPEAKFIFVGEGDLKKEMMEKSNNLGIANACRFFDPPHRSELIEMFKACQCVVIPGRNEPSVNMALCAWAAGKPVVATENSGPAEIVWDDVTGFKIKPNTDSMVEGIGRIFNDFEHAESMGKNGYEAARTAFSWEVYANQTCNVYMQAREIAVPVTQVRERAVSI